MLILTFIILLCFGLLTSCASYSDAAATADGGLLNSSVSAEISVNEAKEI